MDIIEDEIKVSKDVIKNIAEAPSKDDAKEIANSELGFVRKRRREYEE